MEAGLKWRKYRSEATRNREQPLFFAQLKKDPVALVSLVVIGLMVGFALWGFLTMEEADPMFVDLHNSNRGPSRAFWMGTDIRGRDRFPEFVIGFGNSVMAAFWATTIATVLGTALGTISGYFGGKIDQLVMWFLDFLGIAPSLMVAITIFATILHPTMGQIAWIISIFSWPVVARLIRSKVLQEKEMDYIQASITCGSTKGKILWQQVFPQLYPLIIAGFFLNLGLSIGMETGISFLGFGFPFGVPSLGNLISSAGHIGVILARPWLWAWPVGSVFVLILASHNVSQFLIRISSPDSGH